MGNLVVRLFTSKKYSRLIRQVLWISLITSFLLIIFLSPLQSEGGPYAWVHFSRGDDQFETTPSLENWLTSFIYSAQQNNQPVGVASYTWGSNFSMINGFYGQDEAGLNALDPSDVYVVGDADPPGGLDNYYNTASDELIERTRFIDGGMRRSHMKAITKGYESVIFGSANWTAGALSRQPNAIMIMNHGDVARTFHHKIRSMWEGDNFKDEVDYQIHHQGPNDEEIEIYFIPDVYGNIPEGHAGGVLVRELADAEESVFYHFNYITYYRLVESILEASERGVLAEGVLDDNHITDQDMIEELRSDHTARIWDDGTMHHKTMVFDLERIAFGSPNHTASALVRSPEYSNQEVLVVIDDFRLARRFTGEHRRMMGLMDEDGLGPPDSFDEAPPDPVTNLEAENVAGESNQLRISWDPPDDPGDFSRYYIFANTKEELISSQSDICDFEDTDGDGMICEDPHGNFLGFPSGPSIDQLQEDDMDGDGMVNEDPWLFPEAQVKAAAPADTTETILDSIDYGQTLPDNTDIWLAMVAVDKHGNESEAKFFGPVRSLPRELGALPEFELEFSPDVSEVQDRESELSITVANEAEAEQNITEWTLDPQSGERAFSLLEEQQAPAGWTVVENEQTLTFQAEEAAEYIEPGEEQVFNAAVQNPPQAGESEELTAVVVDDEGVEVPDLTVGSLEIKSTEVEMGVTDHFVTDGVNTIRELDGTERLLLRDDTAVIEFEESLDTPLALHYRFDTDPVGVGEGSEEDFVAEASSVDQENTLFEAVIENDTALVGDGTSVHYLWAFDGDVITRGGETYRYSIGEDVSRPDNLIVELVEEDAVTLSFRPVTDEDFEKYRIYYSTDEPLTTGDDYITETDQFPDQVKVDGLTPGTEYFFAVTAVDDVGNESNFSNTVSATPGVGVYIDEIFAFDSDRTREAHEFDGSESFRLAPVKIRFTFTEPPSSPVEILYDIDSDPDVHDEDTRRISALGGDTLWEAAVSVREDDFEPGAEFRFVIKAGEEVFHRSGDFEPFKYYYEESIPEVKNLEIIDTGGGEVSPGWDPVTMTGFGEYRIFYGEAPDTPTTSSSTWRSVDEGKLTLRGASNATVQYLNPGVEYRFRIAAVDDSGKIGPLSETVNAVPGAEGTLLLSELSPHSSPGWVELTSQVEQLDLTDYYLSDLEGDTVPLAEEQTTLHRGERAVTWFGSGTTETDGSGDLSGSGRVDIYRPGAGGWALEPEVGQLLVRAANGDTVDAVVYRPDPQTVFDPDDDDRENVQALVDAGHWDSADSSAAINFYDQERLSRPVSFYRRSWFGGELLNDGARTDWSFTGSPQPGNQAEELRVRDLAVEDNREEEYHYFQVQAQEFRGEEYLKNTEYEIEMQFNRHPAPDTGLFLWYDTAVDPVGFTRPARGETAALEGSYDRDRKLFKGSFELEGLSGGELVRLGFSQVPDRAAPSELDEIFLNRAGESYKFRLDTTSPPEPGDLQVAGKRRSGLLVSWSAASYPNEKFETYRLYYDRETVSRESEYFDYEDIELLGDRRTSMALFDLPASHDTWNLRMGSINHVGTGSDLSDTLEVVRPEPIAVDRLRSSPQDLEEFDGSEAQPGETVTLRARFDREVELFEPKLHWNRDADTVPGPEVEGTDTTVMEQIDEREYRGRIPPGVDGEEVQFVFETDGGLLPYGGEAYGYYVDADPPPEPGEMELEGIRRDGVLLSWGRVDFSDAEFETYRLYYDRETVNEESEYFDYEDIELLGDRLTSMALFDLPASHDTWNLRMTAEDHVGNRSDFSDTQEVMRLEPIAVDRLRSSPQDLEEFDGSGAQPGETVTLRARFDREVELFDPQLHWNRDADTAPGPGVEETDTTVMEQIDEREYRGRIPPGVDGEEVQFVFETDGGLLPPGTEAYGYYVDTGAVPAVNNVSADTIQRQLIGRVVTSLLVTWDSLPPGTDDFVEYRIVYEKGESVSRDSKFLGVDKNQYLADRRTSMARLDGLDSQDTYTIGLYWVDHAGNYSELSDTVTVITKDGEPVDDPATDGKYWATELDGSEYLRKADIEIIFDFNTEPGDPEDVWLHYNIGGDPAEETDGVVEMHQCDEKPVRFYGEIPESEKMTDGTMISYFVQYSHWRYMQEDGTYFRFMINESPPEIVEGLAVNDDENRLFVSWDQPPPGTDFTEYRIRYRASGEEEWNYYDSEDNSYLEDRRTGMTVLSDIDPEKNYYINISVVDKMGLTTYRPSDYLVLRDTTAGDPWLYSSSERVFPIYPGGRQELEVVLRDHYDDPWFDQEIEFVSADDDVLELNGEDKVEVTTDEEGQAAVELDVADDAEPGYYRVRAMTGEEVGERLTFVVRVREQPTDETGKETKYVPFE